MCEVILLSYMKLNQAARNCFTVNQTLRSLPSCADKWENTAWLNLTETDFFFGLNPSSKIHNILEGGSVSVFRQRSAYLGGPHSLSYSQSLGTTETVNLFRYTPENSSSPYNRKMAIEKLKSDYETQK